MNNEVDFVIGQFSHTFLRNKFMTASSAYAFMPFVLLVPPGAQYSSIQKLLRPFNFTSWAAILSIFAFAGISVTVVRWKFKNYRALCFGSQNQSPYMNILIIFVGGTIHSHSLPTKQFGRNIFIIYIIYSLILRNIYQGVLVNHMQSDDVQKPVESVEEMISKDFFFYITATLIEHIESSPIFSRYVNRIH